MSVFAFDGGGALIVRRNFTTEEVKNKKATFALPATSAGTDVEFYAIGNATVGVINTKTELLALVENSASDYNGLFENVTSVCKRTGGFLMTGMLSKRIAASGSTTDVPIVLKRTVAKIAIQSKLSSEFASKYPGKVQIITATLSKAASQSPYFGGTANPGGMTFSSTQPSVVESDHYNNLFYIFENGPLPSGSRVMITMEGIYDKDGDFSTVSDQTPVVYNVEIAGTSDGQILRNGYYRVAVAIAGLTGQDIEATITVADWETPSSQSVDLGN